MPLHHLPDELADEDQASQTDTDDIDDPEMDQVKENGRRRMFNIILEIVVVHTKKSIYE